MPGCRPLNDSEITLVLLQLKTVRDRALFIVGLRTGLRISELLKLKVGDVWRPTGVMERLVVRSGKRSRGRDIALHPQARAVIAELVTGFGEDHSGIRLIWTQPDPESPLFQSTHPSYYGKALTRFTAHKILDRAYQAAGIEGQTGTHTMRKTFAEKVYQALDKDLIALRDALGHKWVSSTQSYVVVNRKTVDSAITSV